MANKPFLAVHTNITDESSTTTTPAVIGRNSVMVTQGQQRRIFDTLTTSIQGNPMAAFGANFQQAQPISYFPNSQRNDFLHAQAQFIPGGVVFRFNNQNNYPPLCHPCNCMPVPQGLTLDQELALREFEKNGLESLLLQEKLKNNPFVLQFHQNKKTSTNDLTDGPSMGQPDFNAAAAFAANNLIKDYPMYSSELHSKARQLNLPKNHKDKQAASACIVICEEKSTMTNGENSQSTNADFKDEIQKTSDSKEPKNVKTDNENNESSSDDKKNGSCCHDTNDLTTTDSEGGEEETDDEHKDENENRQTLYQFNN